MKCVLAIKMKNVLQFKNADAELYKLIQGPIFIHQRMVVQVQKHMLLSWDNFYPEV